MFKIIGGYGMNIDIELYKVFYTVAQIGNITKAAKELMISQPAISKSIKNLENQLGGSLFTRTKRGVVLTEEGKIFYEYIKQAIELIDNAENKFTDLIHLECGTVRIGASTTLVKEFLLPYLEKFHNQYPKIDIKIYTDLTSDLFSKLRNGLLDFIILNMPYQQDEDIVFQNLKNIQDCFVVNRAYPELIEKNLTIQDLESYPLIFQSPSSNTRKFLDTFLQKEGMQLKPSMELASYTLVTELTKSGLEIGYVTKDYIKKELKEKQLYELKITPKIPKRAIGLAYSKRTIPSFSTKKFIEILLQEKNDSQK